MKRNELMEFLRANGFTETRSDIPDYPLRTYGHSEAGLEVAITGGTSHAKSYLLLKIEPQELVGEMQEVLRAQSEPLTQITRLKDS